MSQGPPTPPDLSQLPPDVRRAVEQQMAALQAEREARQAEREARQTAEAEAAELKAYTEKLENLVKEFERAKFGRSSEKLDADQGELAFEDIETAIGTAEAEHEEKQAEGGNDGEQTAGGGKNKRSKGGSGKARRLPKHLPKDEEHLEPEDTQCPCGCGQMKKIGETRSRRLDITPTQYRIKETVQPRYACPHGNAGVTQAKAPAHLIEGGLPTEALIASIIVAKYSEHMPLYRQAQVFERQGIPVTRSMMADWLGRSSYHAAPVVDRMGELIKQSSKLFMDETTAPVLDPGRGRTKTGYFWALARDDRPWNGPDPPGVVFHYRPGRGGYHAEEILENFNGILQTDGYQGYRGLAEESRTGGAPLTLAKCWIHARRELIKATPKSGSPIADGLLKRIAGLYEIEAEIRGCDPEHRRAVRQARSKPVVEEIGTWVDEQHRRLSPKSEMAKALAYILRHWDGLCVFLDDGRVEMDSNPIENAIRPAPLNRKNALFAGHDEGGSRWGIWASLIGTCKLNGVDPYAYLKATLEALAAGHPQSRLDELMPWNFRQDASGSD
ncbi:IS66 family transposase [Rhodovibrio sodomensis]|uniref:IS66 family transposase n=1 Tax=Rhodovibrio sodomensis TaxID=1088 RepID=A0ABS1D9E9_9PROT|nr:IS66 family transposase [Rhodovibrio sodomensis]MBK1666649.1 IS66 family transposase [Rhodovibrio sodomensis]